MQGLIKRLKDLKLAGAAQSIEERNQYAIEHKLSYLEFMEILLEDELNNRKENNYRKRVQQAKFSVHKRLEDFDFSFQPSINQKEINDLAICHFINKKENILFIGQPGTGKTHLAIAIGLKALMKGFKVIFTRIADILSTLQASRADNSHNYKIKQLLQADLLILDELGYKMMDQRMVEDFFEIVSKRYETGSIIITSNKTFQEWNRIFNDSILATAILDRLIHHSHLILIKGESYRIKASKKGRIEKSGNA